MHLEKTNSTDISAIITVTLYKETVADYVLFIEYRTQANKNHWTLLEVSSDFRKLNGEIF